MDHDSLARFQRAEHFARHVSEAMEAIASLMEDPDPSLLDYQRVPGMFAGCHPCTIEALLYLGVLIFRNAKWDPARLREEIPVVVAGALGAEIS